MRNLIILLIIVTLIIIFLYRKDTFQDPAQDKCEDALGDFIQEKNTFIKNPYCVPWCLNKYIEIDHGKHTTNKDVNILSFDNTHPDDDEFDLAKFICVFYFHKDINPLINNQISDKRTILEKYKSFFDNNHELFKKKDISGATRENPLSVDLKNNIFNNLRSIKLFPKNRPRPTSDDNKTISFYINDNLQRILFDYGDIIPIINIIKIKSNSELKYITSLDTIHEKFNDFCIFQVKMKDLEIDRNKISELEVYYDFKDESPPLESTQNESNYRNLVSSFEESIDTTSDKYFTVILNKNNVDSIKTFDVTKNEKCPYRQENYNTLMSNFTNGNDIDAEQKFLSYLNSNFNQDYDGATEYHNDIAPPKYELIDSDGKPINHSGIYPRYKFKEKLGDSFINDGCGACLENFYDALKSIRCSSRFATDCDENIPNSNQFDDPCFEFDCNEDEIDQEASKLRVLQYHVSANNIAIPAPPATPATPANPATPN